MLNLPEKSIFMCFTPLFRDFYDFYHKTATCHPHNFFVKKQQKTKKTIDNLQLVYYTIVIR